MSKYFLGIILILISCCSLDVYGTSVSTNGASVKEDTKSFKIERVFREARFARGNTNVKCLQPIDEASWIWMPGDNGQLTTYDRSIWKPTSTDPNELRFVKFKKEFEVTSNSEPLVFDVSADERYYLMLDGQFISRGPNRAEVENWQYQTYSITGLKPGKHIIEAIVYTLGGYAPLAQLSYKGGFILKAQGSYDEKLTTGKTQWLCGRIGGIEPRGFENGAWGVGVQFKIIGRGPYMANPKDWKNAVVVRGNAGRKDPTIWGSRTSGWMLFPTQLPDQMSSIVRPGVIRAITRKAKWRQSNYVYQQEDVADPLVAQFNDFISGKIAQFVIPANTRFQAAWDLGVYYCAYPVVAMKGAKGASLSWTWAESGHDVKTYRKNNRNDILGKALGGFGDHFECDGEYGEFSSPWFRCGRWCRIDVDTGDKPLVIDKMYLVETRYPLEQESTFSTPQDNSIADIRRICTRAMQMCCHEMLFDCPYYEQQMYPGDTRVQLLVLAALSRDDRMIKRAIELYALATRDNGMCPMNHPTRGLQESLTYTLCYLCMYGDYVKNGSDREWLRARLPALRFTMAGVEYYENAEGLLENIPGWCFMDWTEGWHYDGTAPESREGESISAEINLFWLLAMQSAAATESALGNATQADYWNKKAQALKAKIVEKFWCEKRGLLSGTPSMKYFSEHPQALAIVAGALPKDKEAIAFKHLLEDKDLKRCTVYFSYYLFEAYFKMGRGDLFQKRLQLWRDYVASGVTTLLERPENANIQSRSDCHAWGAHPIWFMQTGLAGIKSDGPFFSKVRIAPSPGTLKEIKASHPHPKGWIKANLKFDGTNVTGTVETPVEGVFEFGGKKINLTSQGVNSINL